MIHKEGTVMAFLGSFDISASGMSAQRVRMDIAAEMILNTDEKSYTIAEKVGYLDANYFSYVFKKKFGVSPSKYRASVK